MVSSRTDDQAREQRIARKQLRLEEPDDEATSASGRER